MLTERFLLLEVIGKLLRAALATKRGDYPERWVELIEHLNENEAAGRNAQEQKRDPNLRSSIG